MDVVGKPALVCLRFYSEQPVPFKCPELCPEHFAGRNIDLLNRDIPLSVILILRNGQIAGSCRPRQLIVDPHLLAVLFFIVQGRLDISKPLIIQISADIPFSAVWPGMGIGTLDADLCLEF